MIPDRLLGLAALALWSLAGSTEVVAAFTQGVDARAAAWLCAWLVFAGAYVGATQHGVAPTRRGAFVAVEGAAALVVIGLGGGLAPEALLAIPAAHLPFFLPPRSAAAWLAVQVVLTGAVQAPRIGAEAWFEAALYGTFQVFALGAASLAVSEGRARAELAEANAALVTTRERLAEESRLGERGRIARDLHDALGHHLTALSLQLEVAAHLATGPAAAPVAEAQAIARGLLADVREVVSALRAEGPLDLGSALDAVTRVPTPRVHLVRPDPLVIPDPRVAAALLRCVQEIVTNAARHAAAANVWVTVVATDGGLVVEGRDDGRGGEGQGRGTGLQGMRERLGELGGSLTVTTAPGAGFTVRAAFPQEGR